MLWLSSALRNVGGIQVAHMWGARTLSCQPSPSSVFVSPDVPLLRKLFSGAASSTHLSTHSQLKDLPQVQYTVLGFVLKL